VPGRLKYDKRKYCIKCKLNFGNIVIRHAVYCRYFSSVSVHIIPFTCWLRECFTPMVTIKFRRALEPHVNANAGTSKRPKLKASGSLVLGFSGGLGSSVLLDLVHKTYFSSQSPKHDNGVARGGINHPRNTTVWTSCAVCYVEGSSAFPGV